MPGALESAVELNTRLYLNCLAGVSDAHAVQRPSGLVNSMAYVACHVLDARFYLARFLGLELHNPIETLVGAAQSIDDIEALPTVAVLTRYWSDLSLTVQACVAGLLPADLNQPSTQRFPVKDRTMGAAIEFQLHHESYHIGQLALLRKYYGYPAMTYR